jgi:hypothetical protein
MSDILSYTDMALLMFVSAMLKQFVVSIEWVFTKRTVWVTSESRFVILVEGFVTKLVMLRQLTWSEESMLMRKDLFESSAQITDDNQIWVYVSIKTMLKAFKMITDHNSKSCSFLTCLFSSDQPPAQATSHVGSGQLNWSKSMESWKICWSSKRIFKCLSISGVLALVYSWYGLTGSFVKMTFFCSVYNELENVLVNV